MPIDFNSVALRDLSEKDFSLGLPLMRYVEAAEGDGITTLGALIEADNIARLLDRAIHPRPKYGRYLSPSRKQFFIAQCTRLAAQMTVQDLVDQGIGIKIDWLYQDGLTPHRVQKLLKETKAEYVHDLFSPETLARIEAGQSSGYYQSGLGFKTVRELWMLMQGAAIDRSKPFQFIIDAKKNKVALEGASPDQTVTELLTERIKATATEIAKHPEQAQELVAQIQADSWRMDTMSLLGEQLLKTFEACGVAVGQPEEQAVRVLLDKVGPSMARAQPKND